jgi:GTPase SAR1 family protein
VTIFNRFQPPPRAAIICYDVTSPSSWDRVEHWLDELRRNEDTCRVYICGNKIDLLVSFRVFHATSGQLRWILFAGRRLSEQKSRLPQSPELRRGSLRAWKAPSSSIEKKGKFPYHLVYLNSIQIVQVYDTSSKTGEHVDDMFRDIVQDFVNDPVNTLTEFNKALKLSIDSVDADNKRPCCSKF